MSVIADRFVAALARTGETVVLGGQATPVAVFAMSPNLAKTYLTTGEVDLAPRPVIGLVAPGACATFVGEMTTVRGQSVTVRAIWDQVVAGEVVARLAVAW
jgi:hypothetical protein